MQRREPKFLHSRPAALDSTGRSVSVPLPQLTPTRDSAPLTQGPRLQPSRSAGVRWGGSETTHVGLEEQISAAAHAPFSGERTGPSTGCAELGYLTDVPGYGWSMSRTMLAPVARRESQDDRAAVLRKTYTADVASTRRLKPGVLAPVSGRKQAPAGLQQTNEPAASPNRALGARIRTSLSPEAQETPQRQPPFREEQRGLRSLLGALNWQEANILCRGSAAAVDRWHRLSIAVLKAPAYTAWKRVVRSSSASHIVRAILSGRIKLDDDKYRQILVVVKRMVVVCATKIQTWYRGSKQRGEYRRQCVCLMRLQAKFRRYIQGTKYQLHKKAFIVLQKCWRGLRHRLILRQMIDLRRQWRRISEPLADSLKFGGVARVQKGQVQQTVSSSFSFSASPSVRRPFQECEPHALDHALRRVETLKDENRKRENELESKLKAVQDENRNLQACIRSKEEEIQRLKLKICAVVYVKGSDSHSPHIERTKMAAQKQRKRVQDANENYVKPNKDGHSGFLGCFGNINNHFNCGLDKFNGHPVVMADGSQNFFDMLEEEMKRELCECDDPEIFNIRTSNYNGIVTNLRTEWEFVVSPDIPPPDVILTDMSPDAVDEELLRRDAGLKVTYVKCPDDGVSPGLKWENLGRAKPNTGTEIKNAELALALEGKKEFTRDELISFRVSNLTYNSYIQVGNCYVRAAAVFKEYPGQAGYGEEGMRRNCSLDGKYQRCGKAIGRPVVPLDMFKKDRMAIDAKLSRAEVIGLRLYTGPAYMPINGALRAQRFRKGKLSCRKCFKGNYTIVDGKSPCHDSKCKKSCSRCKADFSGWSCRVREFEDRKTIVYQYCTPPGRVWKTVSREEAATKKMIKNHELASALQEKLNISEMQKKVVFSEPEFIQTIDRKIDLSYDSCIRVLFPPNEWKEVGTGVPTSCTEISNWKLAEAIAKSGGFFTKEELEEIFDGNDLDKVPLESYIMVGKTCYKAVRQEMYLMPDLSVATTKTFKSLDEIKEARANTEDPVMKEIWKRRRCHMDPAAFDFEQTYTCGSCAPGVHCFTTCVSVINSAICKLAPFTDLSPNRVLFRGLNGMAFPQDILDIETKPKGFVEFGFSSATPDRDVAIAYSGGICTCKEEAEQAEREGRVHCGGWVPGTENYEGYCSTHRSTILEIATGQIDRGASLKWVSQFAAENEHTLLPLSNFEITGIRRENHCNVLEADLNLNLHAQTLEQLRESRQIVCLDFGRKLVEEAQQLLSGTHVISKSKVDAETEHVLACIRSPEEAKKQDVDPVDYFNNINHFRHAINTCFDNWRAILSRSVAILLAHAETMLAEYKDYPEAQQRAWFAGDQSRQMESVLFQALHIMNRIQDQGDDEDTCQENERTLMRIYDLLGWLLSQKPTGASSHVEIADLLAKRGKALASGQDVDYDQALKAYEDAIDFQGDSFWEKAKNFKEMGVLLEKRGASSKAQEGDFKNALDALNQSLQAIQEYAQDGKAREGDPTLDDERFLLFEVTVQEKIGLLLYRHLQQQHEGWRRLEQVLISKVKLKGANSETVANTLTHLREVHRGGGYEVQIFEDDHGNAFEPGPCRIFNILTLQDVHTPCHPERLQDCMQSNADSTNILEWACRSVCLCARSEMDADVPYFIEHSNELVQIILEGMVKYIEHVPLQTAACAALASVLEAMIRLSSDRMVHERMEMINAIHSPLSAVLLALDIHGSEREMQQEGLKVLKYLLCGSQMNHIDSMWTHEKVLPENALELERQDAGLGAKESLMSRGTEESPMLRKAILHSAPRIILQSLAFVSSGTGQSDIYAVVCALESLEKMVFDLQNGQSAAKSIAFVDGRRYIELAMKAQANVAEIHKRGQSVIDSCAKWFELAAIQRDELRKQFEDSTSLALFPHLKTQKEAKEAEQRALAAIEAAKSLLDAGNVAEALRQRDTAVCEFADSGKLSNHPSKGQREIKELEDMIQQVTDSAAKAAADKAKAAAAAAERQKHTDAAFQELSRSNIKNAAQHLERALQHYRVALASPDLLPSQEESQRIKSLEDQVRDAQGAAKGRAEDAVEKARRCLDWFDIDAAQSSREMAQREFEEAGTVSTQAIGALNQKIAETARRKQQIAAGDRALGLAIQIVEGFDVHALSCFEMAEQISVARKRQAEAVEQYNKGHVSNSPWATQTEAQRDNLNERLEELTGIMEARVRRHLEDGDQAMAAARAANPSDLEVATEKCNAALSEYKFVADWDDQICDGERGYRSKVNEARTLKESVMASVYEREFRLLKGLQ